MKHFVENYGLTKEHGELFDEIDQNRFDNNDQTPLLDDLLKKGLVDNYEGNYIIPYMVLHKLEEFKKS